MTVRATISITRRKGMYVLIGITRTFGLRFLRQSNILYDATNFILEHCVHTHTYHHHQSRILLFVTFKNVKTIF